MYSDQYQVKEIKGFIYNTRLKSYDSHAIICPYCVNSEKRYYYIILFHHSENYENKGVNNGLENEKKDCGQ